MRSLLLVLAVVAGVAEAQPSRSRLSSTGSSSGTSADGGVALTAGDIWTTAAPTLFVDPLGSDTNPCTASGTAACLTQQGALNKLPKNLRHLVTISVAAGNYAGATVAGFTCDPSFQKVNAGILLDGVLGNVTPTTGTATGTATAGSAGTTTTYGTLTDGAATWTVNDAALVGKLIVITGGTGSGQTKVIVSNTATVLTIAGTWTAPSGTSTYAIQAPTSIITSTAALVPQPISGTAFSAAGLQFLNNNSPGCRFAVRNMGYGVGASLSANFSGPQTVELLQNVIAGNAGSGAIAIAQGSNVFLTATAIAGAVVGISPQTGAQLTVANSYIAATSGLNIITGANATVTSTQFVGTNGIAVGSGSRATATSVRCNCASAASSSCLLLGNGGHSVVQAGASAGMQIATALDVTNCSYGVNAGAGNGAVFSTLAGTFTGNALIYAALASQGASITLPSTTPAITGTTAEVSVDNGAVTATFASLGAAYACVVATTGTGSAVCRQ